jgi:ABC-type nitrate/sulfonate/bicarbonate transport system substrate-binding protein
MKNILLALFLIGQLFLSVAYCKKEDPTILRVQLPWMHSSQFAGLYVAQVRKHFEKEGLEVRLIEGGPDINPVKEVQDGRADIAITKLVTAWELAKRGNEVTNIAQIIQGSGVVVVCRISAGVYKLEHREKDRHLRFWRPHADPGADRQVFDSQRCCHADQSEGVRP